MKSPFWIVALATGALAFGIACANAKTKEVPGAAEPASAQLQPSLPPTYNPMQSLAPLVESLQSAVVNLDVEQKVEAASLPQFMSPFFSTPEAPDQIVQGEGSGFVISADGYILTNNHVVDSATKVRVRFSDQRSFDAKVIGTDERTDVALLKIDTKEQLPFVKLGSSDAMQVGDWVVAIGNPFGLGHTVTAGIVSAKSRVIGAGPYDDFIQTDASINPGNSGGPLFNLAGEVIGINTAIVRSGSGIGFAVPTDMIRPLIEDLKDDGRVARGWMGMGLQNLDADLATALKLSGDQKGVVVSQVYDGFPAAEAGLKPRDVIVSLDDVGVDSSESLVRAIGTRKPDETVALTLLRDGKEKVIKVKLTERPNEESLARGEFGSDSKQAPDAEKEVHKSGETALTKLGLTLEPAARYRAASGMEGLVVTGVASGSPADGRLRPGDVVVEINGVLARTSEEANKAIAKSDDAALFVVNRERSQRLVAVPLKK